MDSQDETPCPCRIRVQHVVCVTHQLSQLDVSLEKTRKVFLRVVPLVWPDLAEEGKVAGASGWTGLGGRGEALETEGRTAAPEGQAEAERYVPVEKVTIYGQSRSRGDSQVHASLARSPSSVRSESVMSLAAICYQHIVVFRLAFSSPRPYAFRIAAPISIHACRFSAPCTSSP